MSAPSTLLLRLDGPMQAWGTDSRFGVRDTRREPTKSGVIGLVASALGRERSAPLDDLASLDFGIRVDREGQVLRDFHTAGADGFYRANGSVERKNVIISDRFYLADACFTAGFSARSEAEVTLLSQMHHALISPRWIPFLGRRAFPPADAIALGIQDLSLLEALCMAPAPRFGLQDKGALRFVVDAAALDSSTGSHSLAGADVPLSFQSGDRRYRNREVITLRKNPAPTQ